MKKITLLLMAMITGTAFAQNPNATAEVRAQIVSPLTIGNTNDLSFGTIAASNTDGKVRVDESGNRTFSNPQMEVIQNSTEISPAIFQVTAANQFQYSVYIPSITLTGPGTSMPVSFSHNMKASGNVGSGSAQTLYVGGLLSVNANQTAGDYEGTVTVTVAYE